MKARVCMIALTLFLVAGVATASAQVRFGGHVSLAEDTDFGIGPRAVFGLNQQNLQNISILGTFDWFFIDEDDFGDDASYFEVAGSALYNFDGGQFQPYLGGGLVIGRFSNDADSNVETGLQVTGGTTFGGETGRFTPFVDARFALSGPEQFVISGGVLF